MNDAGIVRNRAKIEGAVNSAKGYLKIMEEGAGLLEIPVGLRRRQAEGQQVQDHRQRAGLDAALDQDVEGTGGARLQVRRSDHRLRLHAGHRHGQRPSGHLLLPRDLQPENCASRASRQNDGAKTVRRIVHPRLAADAVGTTARSARPLAARYRDRRHRPRPGARRALERPDQRRAYLLGGAAHAAGRSRAARADAARRSSASGSPRCCTMRRNMSSAT